MAFPPPPPLPPSLQSSPVQQTVRPLPLRRIAVQQPPSITTAVGAQHGTFLHPPTPASAISINTPSSPYAPSIFSPASASTLPSSSSRGSQSPFSSRGTSAMVSPYNPQEWGRHGPTSGAYMPRSSPQSAVRAENLTGMEASMPSPPPPYSPSMSSPTQHNANNAFGSVQTIMTPGGSQQPEHTPVVASSSRVLSAVNTPQAPSASFPPPPGRDRSSSRPKGDRHFFGLMSRHKAPETVAGPSNMETLRQNTSDMLARTPESHTRIVQPTPEREFSYNPELNGRPPAARRAASTGAIGAAGPSSRRTPGAESPAPAWGPGMPLPPPPPGPPPSNSRSQSMSRTPDHFPSSSGSGTIPGPPTRRPPQTGTSLGPIPPTPADWVDDEARRRSRSPAARGLHIETNGPSMAGNWESSASGEPSTASGSQTSEPQTAHVFSAGGITRSSARRELSSRGIRERRSESRAARERIGEARTAVEPNNNPWARDMEAANTTSSAKPADLVLNPPGGAISRRRTITRGTPRSAGSRGMASPAFEGKQAHIARQLSDDAGEASSAHSTPRTANPATRVMSPEMFAPTPPFSPSVDVSGKATQARGVSPAVPPKALPTPPIQQHGEYSSGLGPPQLSAKDRPISHILHVPNEDAAMQAPLSPARPPSAGVPNGTPKPSERELFAQSALERHRKFIEKEMAVQTDQQRLELFADFIVAESRIRRDQYSAAFDHMAGDLFDLTRDLWRSYHSTGRRSATPNQANRATTPNWRSPGQNSERSLESPLPSSSPTPYRASHRTEPDSPGSLTSQTPGRGDTVHFKGFQPCLSPIPSMAVSTVPDEQDSRGRSASRWWEASAEGSLGRGGKKIERSKRESKYMGLPKEVREHLQWDGENTPPYSGTPGPSIDYSALGPNEYPPEKVGSHEQALPASAHSYQFFTHSAPATPDPYKLDVSRLVTLPPPYPRHHPAVNNNHPELASIRTILRSLGEFDTVGPIKDEFKIRIAAARDQERAAVTERRNHLRFEIQDQIRSGHISFAEAAQAEANFEAQEVQRSQQCAKAEFDGFKKEVFGPLNALFSERVTKATASIDRLKNDLVNDAQGSNPNQTQEEGDEQPELLEKLTLLKWLFEIREHLHRELLNVERERDEHYKNYIMTPYVQSGNTEKAQEVDGFFTKDAQERKAGFEKETLKRFEDFLKIVEANVSRGVEDQLSAFWDIAPGLLVIVQKVPVNLEDCQLLIPPQEYDENPSYYDFPLQYLYSLLDHAKKSAYQFIESQTNLFCLLHEVKTSVMTANTRFLEMQRYMAGEDMAAVEAEMIAIRQDEEARLTVDLKDKVSVVEGQWQEALGNGLEECRVRVERFLVERGGWDESLQE